MTGSATHSAALQLRDKAIDIAAELMQTSKDALDIIDGKVVRRDAPGGASMALGDIARHLAPGSKTRGEREPGLSVTGWFTTDHQVYPYGVHIAAVRVDGETGTVIASTAGLGSSLGQGNQLAAISRGGGIWKVASGDQFGVARHQLAFDRIFMDGFGN